MRLLITGAGGFIGRAVLARALAEGHQATPWDDVPAGPDRLRNADAVIHLAGRYPTTARAATAQQLVEANTALTAAVLDACGATGARPRIVLAGTAAVYGAQDAPLTESTPTRATSAYGASKLGAEALLRAAPGTHTCLRLFNVYGPGQPRSNVFDTIAVQLPADGPVRVRDLNPVRDFVHVDDVARAFVAAATLPAALPPVINIGSGQATSVAELAHCILQAAGQCRVLEAMTAAVAAPDRVVADIALAARALHWQPSVELVAGAADTLARDPQYRTFLETLRHASH